MKNIRESRRYCNSQCRYYFGHKHEANYNYTCHGYWNLEQHHILNSSSFIAYMTT